MMQIAGADILVGDEIGIGDVAYRVTQVDQSGVHGVQTVKHGHSIVYYQSSTVYRAQRLDLRLRSWEFLYKVPR